MAHRTCVAPGTRVDLSEHDPGDRGGYADKADATAATGRHGARLAEQAARLAATRAKALLVVIQGLDCAGKDGTVAHCFALVSPGALQVTSFKAPTAPELAHDFLWRVNAALPPRGTIGIFNRSHYEDVLVVRVDELVPKQVWSRRYDAINEWEQRLVEEGTVIVKCFLHISRDEQATRLRERLAEPTKNWKFSADDLRKRGQWAEYQEAYEAVLSKTSTRWAPWHVIPADHPSTRNALITEILADTIAELDLQWPALDPAVVNQTIT